MVELEATHIEEWGGVDESKHANGNGLVCDEGEVTGMVSKR
jgi:hypothetical protein